MKALNRLASVSVTARRCCSLPGLSVLLRDDKVDCTLQRHHSQLYTCYWGHVVVMHRGRADLDFGCCSNLHDLVFFSVPAVYDCQGKHTCKLVARPVMCAGHAGHMAPLGTLSMSLVSVRKMHFYEHRQSGMGESKGAHLTASKYLMMSASCNWPSPPRKAISTGTLVIFSGASGEVEMALGLFEPEVSRLQIKSLSRARPKLDYPTAGVQRSALRSELAGPTTGDNYT